MPPLVPPRVHAHTRDERMPIHEHEPWCLQYFKHADCPPHVRIPMQDSDAWEWNARHRWIYDRIAVALSQGLDAGPHGTLPPRFPVFSKPIVNLNGMGVGARVIRSRDEYERDYAAGHMWMTLLSGRHLSSDAAVIDGETRWWRHATGVPSHGGTFDYWIVHGGAEPALERSLGGWIARNLRGYTGMVNLETIGGAIIEAHLRPTDQWPDLYGRGWVDALVALYANGSWDFDDADRRDGFSVILFGPHGRRWRHPPSAQIEEVLALPGVSSVQITFHEDPSSAFDPMPPGGFRLAVVNCATLDAGRAARERLRHWFVDGSQHADHRWADADARRKGVRRTRSVRIGLASAAPSAA